MLERSSRLNSVIIGIKAHRLAEQKRLAGTQSCGNLACVRWEMVLIMEYLAAVSVSVSFLT